MESAESQERDPFQFQSGDDMADYHDITTTDQAEDDTAHERADENKGMWLFTERAINLNTGY